MNVASGTPRVHGKLLSKGGSKLNVLGDSVSQFSKSPNKMQFGTNKASKQSLKKFDYKCVTYKEITNKDFDNICSEINKRLEFNKT